MFVKDPFSTIAAVSTPRGKGGIAVIRISGGETANILEKVFAPKGAPLGERPYRTAVFGEILKDGRVIDTGVCTLYAHGRSFTGELMAELSCHGGTYVTRETLEAVLEAGAEPAGPGEFTRRAFINGKLTLSEAEAVGQLIDADTKSKRELATGAVRGNLSARLDALDRALYEVMTALYAAIDYPEEDVGTEGEDRIYEVVCQVLSEIKKLSATYRTGKAVADGVKTVICGKPNAGKSSLYNALVGEDKAIVTDIAGTTRDTLEDTVDIGGITLLLTDTAGLRDSSDKVEQIGVERARLKIENAELVLCLFDMSEPLDPEEKRFILEMKDSPKEKLCVLNKSDLGSDLGEDDTALLTSVFPHVIELSAKDGSGIETLSQRITELYNSERLCGDSDAIIWDAMQKASLDRAAALLDEAKCALEACAPLDAVGVVTEQALAEMRMVDGRDVSEDIIDGIFSRFCVGK